MRIDLAATLLEGNALLSLSPSAHSLVHMSAPPPIPPRPDGQPGFPGAPPPIPPRLPLPQPPPPPGKVLADGTKAGADVLVRGVKWQASGWLQEGCLPEPWGQQPVMLKRCWTLLLGGPGRSERLDASAVRPQLIAANHRREHGKQWTTAYRVHVLATCASWDASRVVRAIFTSRPVFRVAMRHQS